MPDRRLRGCWTRPRPTGRAPVARTEAIGRREPRAVPVADLARGVGRDVRGLGLRLESSTVGEPCSDVTCNTGSEQPPPIAGGSWTRTECHAHAPTAGVRYQARTSERSCREGARYRDHRQWPAINPVIALVLPDSERARRTRAACDMCAPRLLDGMHRSRLVRRSSTGQSRALGTRPDMAGRRVGQFGSVMRRYGQ